MKQIRCSYLVYSFLFESIGAYFSHKTTSSSDENGFPFVELLHRC